MIYRVSWYLPSWTDSCYPRSVDLSEEERRDLETFFRGEVKAGRALAYAITAETILDTGLIQTIYGEDVVAEKEKKEDSNFFSKFAANLAKPPIPIRHADLVRTHEETAYRSKCPSCPDGCLLVQRNVLTFQLEAGDYCIACGQRFIYEDIEELRAKEGRKRG